MALTEETRKNVDAAMGNIISHCRMGFAGGNHARFCAEQQLRGLITALRFTLPRGTDDDFCLEKLEDEYQKRISTEMNY
jgi:hypothetical protein